MDRKQAASPSRWGNAGIVATTRRPAAWVRLGAGIGAAGYLVMTAYGVAFQGPYRSERLQQLLVALACAAAFLVSRERPALAARLTIGAVLAELLLSIARVGIFSGASFVLPLLVTTAGLLLGGGACVAVAVVGAVAVPATLVLNPAVYAGLEPALLGGRFVVLEIVLAASAALTWSSLRAYAGALADSERDAAERLALEDRLRHAQRLETVGQLAGGVAHDFNNLMTAIGGNATVLAAHPDPEVRELAQEIEDAQRRGSALTRQLLAFARRDVRKPEPLDLGEAVRGMGRLLERLLGEQHRLVLDARGAVPVHADRAQLEQVAVNLVANARDAAPGGDVRVGVRALERDAAAALGSPLPDARQALLEVSDDGPGMPAEVAARAFEPFFTTKPRGRGTGLGLATVHGIVAQSGGHVALETAPGRGATFRVFLPLGAGAPAPQVRVAGEPARGGAERILLVEDDAHVRQLAERVLRRAGYRLEVAESAAAALAAFPALGDVALLLTDVAMPGRSGVELAAELRRSAPGLRVLYMSGYFDASLAGAGLDPSRELVQKPFSPEELLRRVRGALDAGALAA